MESIIYNKIKNILYRTKLIIRNPKDVRYFAFKAPKRQKGVVLITHESEKLGASLLLLHIAEEIQRRGIGVYIITEQFGLLNKQYSSIAPTTIVFSKRKLNKVLGKLNNEYGYKRLISNTVITGDCVEIAKANSYKVISLIHELAYVIKMLHAESRTKKMICNSDITIFSTEVAKKEVMSLVNLKNQNAVVRPQGIYFKKPEDQIINVEKNKLINKYNIDLSKPIIIGVGNTTYRKGFDLFLDTADLSSGIQFIWAGKKECHFDEILKKRNEQMPSNFVYVGVLNSEQLAALYSIASVMLMCARKDTLPSTIFESLMFGLPVIGAKDSGGIVDVINTTNGILVDSADPKLFAESVSVLFKNNELLRLKKNIVESNVIDEYSFSGYVDYLLNKFKSIEEYS